MSQLKIVYRATGAVREYPGNARVHTDDEIEQLATLMDQVGWTQPILLDEDLFIIAGHRRLRAAKLRKRDKVPTIQLAGLTEAQKALVRVSDNQMTIQGDWDIDALAAEINTISDGDLDLELTGFDMNALTKLLKDDEAAGAALPDGPGGGAYEEQYGVIVTCMDERHQKQVFDKLVAEGYTCKVVAT